MGGVGAGNGGPAGVPGGADADVALGGSFGGQGVIGGEPFGGAVMGPPSAPNFGAVPGALSDLGKVTLSSAIPAVASVALPTLGGILAGLPGSLAGTIIGSILSGDLGKGFAGIPGQMASFGTNLAARGAGYGIPGMVVSALVNGLVPGGEQGEAQPQGDIGEMGFGGPDALANALMAGGVDQGMVPGVGAIAPQAAPSPVAQATQPQPYSLSPQPFGWYGMKRVNLPWVSQSGARSPDYKGGNYGGMKRV